MSKATKIAITVGIICAGVGIGGTAYSSINGNIPNKPTESIEQSNLNEVATNNQEEQNDNLAVSEASQNETSD